MTQTRPIAARAALILATTVFLVGCEDAAKKSVVHAAPPATTLPQAAAPVSSTTPAVPAPIDEVAEMTFPVDPRLKQRAEEAAKNLSHDLPLTVNDEVLGFLNFFQTPRGRAIVETGLRRAGRYHDMIFRVLQEEGLPQDLIYLAQAESAFQPLALSRAGARGIWQFVAWRGNEYGLRHTWWVDERQDP